MATSPTRLDLLVAFLAAFATCAAGGAALADEPKPGAPDPAKQEEKKEEKKEVSVSERVPTDEEARAFVEALQAATKKKGSKEALHALANLEGLVHREFLKPLGKVLSHEDSEVALRAAALLEKQKPRGLDEKALEKDVEKAAKELWKAGAAGANDKRPRVRAAVVKALGAWGVPLDDRQYDDADRLWRGFENTMDPSRAGILVDLSIYAGAVKDKRFARHLAEWLEEPSSTSPNAPSNPPASWWEAKWKSWKEAESHVHAALKAITGEDFKTTEEARLWIQSHASAGFKW